MTDTRASPVNYDPFALGELAGTCPTTAAQKEVFSAAHWGREASCAYNEAFTLRLSGALDVAALGAALDALAARHEALRMALTPDGLTACIARPEPVPLPLQDGDEAALAAALTDEAEAAFDLVKGPLFRARLLRLSPTEHVLIFCAHHLVADGWSLAVVVKDLAALYSGRPLAPAGAYSDYAARERARDGRADEAYWTSLYAGGAPVLDLPLDGPRPPSRPYAARREDLPLSTDLIKRLKDLGAKNGASLFTVLLAGYHALLHRLSGQEELVVGVPAAGQNVEGDDTLVGHCVNLLPIPARLAPTSSFQELLQQLRKTVLDAFDHQQFTYGSLLTSLKVDRDPSRLPLVSVIFNIDQGLTADSCRFSGLSARFATVPRRYENFELFFNVIEIDGKTTIECQYLTDLFAPETIRAHLAAYVKLLDAAAAAPEQAIGALPIVAAAELAQMAAWNETDLALPAAATIHGMIEAQARNTPGRVAVSCGDDALTYAELIAASGRLAQHLRRRGVKPGVLVGVCVERSLDMLVALLGILRAGGAYVPIDPALPADRIGFMLEDTEASLLLVGAATRAAMPPGRATVVDLDAERAAIAALAPIAEISGASPAEASADDIAYVIFTSGSTGRPKGVLCPHRGVASLLTSMLRAPGLGAEDRQLAVTTISFDVHVPDLYLPLVCGAKLVIARKDETLDGARLGELLAKNAVTSLQATPATWRLLLDAAWPGAQTLTAISTGEPLPRDLAAALLPKVGRLWNMYGPTETTVYSTGGEVTDADRPILIGRPLANTKLFIVNALGATCPVGVPGELLIGGAGVTRGYLKRPELTAAAFVTAPDGRERVYKTGDLARFLADGRVECLGRNDHQVKVRGYRIELGEIEAELAKRPGIKACAVGVRDRAADDRRLVAWYVPATGASLDAKALREGLRAFLPDYMVPQNFLAVDALPLTPSGKVDRKKLPSPFAPASTPAAIGPRVAGTPLEASAGQRRILALEAARPELTLYNLPTAFRIFGGFEPAACAAALEKFVNRHEALRTSFAKGLPVVAERLAFRPRLVDLEGKPRDAQETQLAQDFFAAAHTRIDLATPPLFQATIYKLAAQEHVLFIMAHQSIWDGWSFDIFVRELSALYEAEVSGTTAALPPLRIGYADYALWQNRSLNGPVMSAQLNYWRAKLAKLPPPPELGTLRDGRARPPVFSYKGHSTSYFMPRDLANALTAVGREAGASFFQVLLAAYYILLSRMAGAAELCVSTPVRGRDGADVEGIVGSFVNLLVLRATVDPSQPFLDFLRQVRQTALEALAHDALPFEHLVAALGADGDPARVPLTPYNFSFQDARTRNTSFGQLPFKQLNIEPLTAPCELNFWVKESNESLVGSMNYATDLFDEPTMKRFLAAYDALLTAIVAHPRALVQDLSSDPAAAANLAPAAWLRGIPELEQSLTRLDAVKEAAATIQYDAAGSPRLTVHYTMAAAEFITATDLRKHARAQHGDALVPQAFIEVEHLPYLSSGKVDKIKLLPPVRVEAGGDAAARSPAEAALASIWAEILGVDEVPLNGNFFELGGHSLLAIQMIGRVERDTGVKLGRMAVTLNTLAQIAKSMDFAGEGGPEASAVEVVAPPPAAPAPPAAKGAGKFWRKLRGGAAP